MTAMFIICLVMLGFMSVINLISSILSEKELKPVFFLNFLAMSFAIITVGIALSR